MVATGYRYPARSDSKESDSATSGGIPRKRALPIQKTSQSNKVSASNGAAVRTQGGASVSGSARSSQNVARGPLGIGWSGSPPAAIRRSPPSRRRATHHYPAPRARNLRGERRNKSKTVPLAQGGAVMVAPLPAGTIPPFPRGYPRSAPAPEPAPVPTPAPTRPHFVSGLRSAPLRPRRAAHTVH